MMQRAPIETSFAQYGTSAQRSRSRWRFQSVSVAVAACAQEDARADSKLSTRLSA
jgi:hypothetical protein